MKWTERWMARAQRQADLRAERFLLNRAPLTQRYVNADWPGEARPDDASLRLASAWLTWVGRGPICGPDGVEVTVWVQSAGQHLPFDYMPGDQAWLTRSELLASRKNSYTVCVRRLPAGAAENIRSFAVETSARWYAVGLAQQVSEVGITALRPADIPVRPPPTVGIDKVLVDGIVSVGVQAGRGVLWLPQRARGSWQRMRTGRR